MMKLNMSVILLVCLLFGCAVPPLPVNLYGVSGANEGRMIVGQAHRSGPKRGIIEITLPDGEQCTGNYSIIRDASSTALSASWNSLYQSVYGSGQATTVQSTGAGMATAVGNNGTVLEVNFLADTFSGHGFGVAKDNRGNIYRVQF
jgi:hypothetical protein